MVCNGRYINDIPPITHHLTTSEAGTVTSTILTVPLCCTVQFHRLPAVDRFEVSALSVSILRHPDSDDEGFSYINRRTPILHPATAPTAAAK